MRIGVIKGGANITFSSNNGSAGNADILYALRVLDPSRNEVTIITHRTRNTKMYPVLKFKELHDKDLNLDDYDAILLFNYSINFFGGAESPSLNSLYRALHNSSVPIFYVQTDGQLPLKEFWPMIRDREWAKGYTEDEFSFNGDRVVVLQQGRDLSKCATEIRRVKNTIIPRAQKHYPWERTILHNRHKFFPRVEDDVISRPYSLIYGGATRNAKRKRRIQELYFGHEFMSLLFGNLRLDMSSCTVARMNKVSYQEFVKIMKKGIATVIIGDVHYENNYFTLRMYESLLAGCIVMIDDRMDVKHNFYDREFSELYVKNRSDIESVFNTANLQATRDDAYEWITSTYNEEIATEHLNGLIERLL